MHVDDYLDAFLEANRADAEHRANVDEPQATHLHEMLHKVRSRTHHDLFALLRGDDDIVRHQPMAAFDKVKRHLAFSDTGLSGDQQADPIHGDEGSVYGLLQRKLIVQELAQEGHEASSGGSRHKNRHIYLRRHLHQFRINLVVFRKKDTRNRELDQIVEGFAPARFGEVPQVQRFGVAQDLNALVGKEVDIPGQRESRAMQITLLHFPFRGIDRIDGADLQPNTRGELLDDEGDGQTLLLEYLRSMWHGIAWGQGTSTLSRMRCTISSLVTSSASAS